jgi:hypothetical protein
MCAIDEGDGAGRAQVARLDTMPVELQLVRKLIIGAEMWHTDKAAQWERSTVGVAGLSEERWWLPQKACGERDLVSAAVRGVASVEWQQAR